MAGPKPDDPYKPNNSVAPDTRMPYDTLSTKASPEDFGAALGRGVENVGKGLQETSNQYYDYKMTQQGLANEHAANQAEMQLSVEGGNIYNNYKNLEGLDASNARAKTIDDLTALNDKIRKGLGNPMAQKAYEQLSTRRMQFMIGDMNNYAATQQKKAYRDGNVASMNLSLDKLSSPDVAGSEAQSGFETGNAIHQLNALFTSPEYGDFRSVPVNQDSKTGKLVFDTKTEQGKIAQATYDDKLNQVTDKAWVNRISAVAFNPDGYDNINKAVNMLQVNKDNMSAATYAKLSHSLSGPYRTGQARDIADQALSTADFDYKNSFNQDDVGSKIKTLIPGMTVTSEGRSPEHNAEVGGAPNSQHLKNTALDLVLPKGVTFDQFKSQLDMVGIKPTELLDEKDHVHVAWGPKKNDNGAYQSKADYLRDNWDPILSKVRETADAKWGDPTLTDQTVAYAQTKMHQVITGQEMRERVDKDDVLSFVQGKTNKGNPVTDVSQLYNADPKVRDAWVRFQADNPYGAARIEEGVIKANAQGKALGYGSGFWSNYLAMTSGRQPDVTKFSVSNDKTSSFTNTGFEELYKRSQDGLTPEGKTFQNAEAAFLTQAHKEYTGSGIVSGMTPEATTGDFNQYLKEVLPKISAAKAEGKTAAQMFSPTINGKPNPDLITSSVKPPDIMPLFKRYGQLALTNGGTVPAATNTSKPEEKTNFDPNKKYGSYDELMKDAPNMSKDQFLATGRKYGFIGPGVPRPQ